MTRILLVLTTAISLSLINMTAWAHGYEIGSLSIEHPWSRATPPGAPTGGGFMIIHNHGDESDRLVGGNADFTQNISIHQTKMEDGTMKMMPLQHGLEIPAGGSVALEPGSYHLMLMGLQAPLLEGERRSITLQFEKAGSIEVELVVDAIGAMPEHNH